jgi:hypothetical protein
MRYLRPRTAFKWALTTGVLLVCVAWAYSGLRFVLITIGDGVWLSMGRGGVEMRWPSQYFDLKLERPEVITLSHEDEVGFWLPSAWGFSWKSTLLLRRFGFPLWAPLLLFGTPAAFLWRDDIRDRARRRRLRHGLCPTCGYDLVGGSAPCPECGPGYSQPLS